MDIECGVTKVCTNCGRVDSNVDMEFLLWLTTMGLDYRCSDCDPLIDIVPEALTATWGMVICIAPVDNFPEGGCSNTPQLISKNLSTVMPNVT